MKKIYEAAKQILNEKDEKANPPGYKPTKEPWFDLENIRSKIDAATKQGEYKREYKAAKSDYESNLERINKEAEAKHAAAEAEKAQRARDQRQMDINYAKTKSPQSVPTSAFSQPQPAPTAAAKPAPEAKPAKVTKAAKPVSFDQEFARRYKEYKEKGGSDTFDWKDPKSGKVTKIALKLKDGAPEDKEAARQLADYNAMQKKSAERQRELEDDEDVKEDVYRTIRGILEASATNRRFKFDAKKFKEAQRGTKINKSGIVTPTGVDTSLKNPFDDPYKTPNYTTSRDFGKWAEMEPGTGKLKIVRNPGVDTSAFKSEPISDAKPSDKASGKTSVKSDKPVTKTSSSKATTDQSKYQGKSAFQKEFDRQYDEKGPGKTFPWTDPVTGKTTQILLKKADETPAPKPADQKLSDYNALQAKSVETQKKNEKRTQDVENLKKMAGDERHALEVDRLKKMAGDDIPNVTDDDNEPDEIEKVINKAEKNKSDKMWADLYKEKDDEANKLKAEYGYTSPVPRKKNTQTNEGKQMSVNKKFNVSDDLYASVMEVLQKSSGGTVPTTKKEKKLAAMHGDPSVITHGDVLKARGVKMKEEIEQVDEGERGDARRVVSRAMNRADDVISKHNKQSNSPVEKTSLAKRKQLINKDISKMSSDQVRNVSKGMRNEETEYLDEAKRLVSKHGTEGQKYTAKVYKDPEYNEYQVHYFKDGKHMGEGPVSYHGDDKEDAQNTADHEIKRMNSVKEGFEIVTADQLDELSRGKLVSYVNKVAGLKGKSAGSHQAGLKAAAQKIAAMKRGKKEEPMTSSGPKKTGAGILLAAARKRASGETAMEQKVLEGTMRNGKYVDDAPRPGTGEVPLPDEGWRPKQAAKPAPVKKPAPTKAGSTTKAMDDSEE